jgi:hypothetical protein
MRTPLSTAQNMTGALTTGVLRYAAMTGPTMHTRRSDVNDD